MENKSGLGALQVVATSNRGLNPEELAAMALAKIISVSDTAPPAIRDQAMAYRNSVHAVLVHYLRQAQASERTTIVAKLRSAGHAEAANILTLI